MRGSAAFRTSVTPGGGLAGPWVQDPLWNKAKAVPSLDLRFAECKCLNDSISDKNLITFTRASSGTYVDSAGLIKTATTNLLLRSEEFNDAAWTKGSTSFVTPDATTAPTGSLTADLYTTTGAASNLYNLTGITVTSSTVYTFSVYVKLGTMSVSDFKIAIYDVTNSTFIAVDVVPSQVPNNSTWTRVSYSFTTPGTCTSVRVYPFRNSAGITSSTVYLWGAQLEESSSVGEYIPTTSTINSAPRFDHDPTTGESLGLLVEEQRTNSVRNNTMLGAVAGTPGTIPTNWQVGGNAGLSREIVGTGIENGISYIDLRLFGTVASVAIPEATIAFDSNASTAAAVSQPWTVSSYVKVMSGSLSNVLSGEVFLIAFNGSGTLTEAGATSFSYETLTGKLPTCRVSSTRTLTNPDTASINSRIDVNFTAGGGYSVDIILRIGMPQLEQGAFATSVIPTTGTAVTRAADLASITGSNFSSWYNQSEGTVFTDAYRATDVPGGDFPAVFYASDGTDSNRILASYMTSTLSAQIITAGGVAQVAHYPGGLSGVLRRRTAAASKLNDFYAITNGDTGNAKSDTAGTMPTLNQLNIGSSISLARTNMLNGHIRRITYWPTRLSDLTLQKITQ